MYCYTGSDPNKKKRRFTLYKLFSGSDICSVTNEKWKHDYKSMRIYIQKDRKKLEDWKTLFFFLISN